MVVIDVDIDVLLKFRRKLNKPLFGKFAGQDEVKLYVQVDSGVLLKAVVNRNSDVFNALRPFVNQPIEMFDKRVQTWDFSKNTEWSSPNNSTFVIQPESGWKYLVTDIIIRFPRLLKLTSTNRLVFQVWKYVESINSVVPVIDLRYGSISELLKKSNVPMSLTTDVVPDAFNDKMVELRFVYANPFNLEGSPIELRSSLNEKIVIFLEAHQPVKDINGQTLTDGCWAVVNAKRLLDF